MHHRVQNTKVGSYSSTLWQAPAPLPPAPPQLDALWQASCEITLLACRAAIPEGGQQSPAQLFLRPQHQQEKLLTRRRPDANFFVKATLSNYLPR
jgi:hypothetical protein